MKSIIAYGYCGSAQKSERKHTFWIGGKPFTVRIEVTEKDAFHALDSAKPRDGETVLNSMEIE